MCFLLYTKKDFTQQNLVTICFLLLSNDLPVLNVTHFSLRCLYCDDFFPFSSDFHFLTQYGGIFNHLCGALAIRAPCESIHFSIFLPLFF